ncbi:hypothetical protein [Nonomuraea typhae]|uniref:hypothetical protein n=1 Tax=Nonomuraea typhae TaxID=2603600 RepID=UPI0012F79D50|nr:hypothetical protein [Nonomuraea typhae]
MSLRQRCALVLLGVLVMSFAPLPAHAAGIEECPPGSICGWSGESFSGTMTRLPPGAGCVKPPFPIRSAANTFRSPGIPAVAGFYALPGCASYVGGVGPAQSLWVISPPAASVMLVW